MKVIAGLGNPTKKYERSRHNLGFMAVEALSGGGDGWKTNASLLAQIKQDGDILYFKPTTFMNNSGQAVAAILRFYKVGPSDLWIAHDDLDLPLGKAQIRRGGGTAGHHGLESVIERIGSSDFGRIRLGIRGAKLRQYHNESGIDTNDFIMGDVSAEEEFTIGRVIDELAARFAPNLTSVVNIVV